VLGLEVVLADGTVMTSLNKMIKNNAGFDLKHLFIGSEGTLGVVSEVTFRLMPVTESRLAFLQCLASPAQAFDLVDAIRAALNRARFRAAEQGCRPITMTVVQTFRG